MAQRIQEGALIYFGPAGQEHSADGRPRPPTPAFCPVCGLALRYWEWNDDPVYPAWICDGLWTGIPILGRLYRFLNFARGAHYTFIMPPFQRTVSVLDERYDRFSGKRIEPDR